MTGMEAHVCVLQTCLYFLASGIRVHVVRDAVCSRNTEDKEAPLRLMEKAEAILTTTEIALFEILGRDGTDEFRAISRRIR